MNLPKQWLWAAGLAGLLIAPSCGPAGIAALAAGGGGGGGGGGDPITIVFTLNTDIPAEIAKCLLLHTDTDFFKSVQVGGQTAILTNVLSATASIERRVNGVITPDTIARRVTVKVTGSDASRVGAFELRSGTQVGTELLVELTGTDVLDLEFRAFELPDNGVSYALEIATADFEGGASVETDITVATPIELTKRALFIDENDNGLNDAGDRIVLSFDTGVTLVDGVDPDPNEAFQLLSSSSSPDFGLSPFLAAGPSVFTNDDNPDRSTSRVTINLGDNYTGDFGIEDGTQIDLEDANLVLQDESSECAASLASTSGLGQDVLPFFVDSGRELEPNVETAAGLLRNFDNDAAGTIEFIQLDSAFNEHKIFEYREESGVWEFRTSSIPTMVTQRSKGRALAYSDFDGDGFMDVVVGMEGNSGTRDEVLFFNPSSGAFDRRIDLTVGTDNGDNGRGGGSNNSRFTDTVVTFDLDNDGVDEVITGGNYAASSSDDPYGIIVWEFNGDAVSPEFAIIDRFGLKASRGNNLASLAVHGFTNSLGESTAYLLAGGSGGIAALLYELNPATSLFELKDVGDLFPTGSSINSKQVLIGDLDGSGEKHLDLVVLGASESALPSVFLDDGTGFGKQAFSTVSDYDGGALADFDNDGDVDIIGGLGKNNARRNRLFLNDGTGAFSDEDSFEVLAASSDTSGGNVLVHETTWIGVADLNLDGDIDIVVGNRDGILENNDSKGDRIYLNGAAGVWSQ